MSSEELVATARKLDEGTPGYEVYKTIRAQLDALAEWTSDGGDPTIEQRHSLTMGRLAQAEFETTDDPALIDFVAKVTELNFYASHWLDDDDWLTLDDEDLSTFFPRGVGLA